MTIDLNKLTWRMTPWNYKFAHYHLSHGEQILFSMIMLKPLLLDNINTFIVSGKHRYPLPRKTHLLIDVPFHNSMITGFDFYFIKLGIDGLVQDCCNSIVNALELPPSCTNPLICGAHPLVNYSYHCKQLYTVP